MAWLWLWTDILDCSKLAELDDTTFRGWIMLLACAKRHDLDGCLPRLKDLAYWCRKDESAVKTWLLVLAEHQLVEREGDDFKIHDWHYWQPGRSGPTSGVHGKAKTNAERQREYRQREREKRETDERNVTEPPVTPITNNNRGEERREGITLRNDNSLVTNNVTPNVTPSPSPPLTPHQQECINQATEKWGASNGDMYIGEMLKVYHEDIVMECMDKYWDKHGQQFKPALFRGYCKTALNDQLTRNGRP